MTQPVPEESNEALDVTEQPPGTHAGELPDEGDAGREPGPDSEAEENAETSADQPSDSSD